MSFTAKLLQIFGRKFYKKKNVPKGEVGVIDMTHDFIHTSLYCRF